MCIFSTFFFIKVHNIKFRGNCANTCG